MRNLASYCSLSSLLSGIGNLSSNLECKEMFVLESEMADLIVYV